MRIKKIEARSILDSRKKPTIEISVKTAKGNFISSAPSGESKGRFEAKPYARSLKQDIEFLNKIKVEKLNKFKLEEFKDLKEIEGLFGRTIGANSLFAFEASILKALSAEQEKELWKFLSKGKPKFPFPIGNTIGGGMHSFSKHPDFQEFLFINKTRKFYERVFLNQQAYKIAGGLINAEKTEDEGAWYSSLNNEEALEIMKLTKELVKKELGENIDIGVDTAASTFFTGKNYSYKNKKELLNREQQINYIVTLINNREIEYIEDPLEQGDFEGFAEVKGRVKGMVVGDDLTVTNLLRLKKAIQNKSINAIIVKPNQNGSLIKVKEIMDFCKKREIKTIISHRSGETLDTTIADLAVAWKSDFIKTGIQGREREAKLNRIIEIERSVG